MLHYFPLQCVWEAGVTGVSEHVYTIRRTRYSHAKESSKLQKNILHHLQSSSDPVGSTTTRKADGFVHSALIKSEI